MKILGIDSSGLVGSVAYIKDGEIISEYTLNHKKTHSETLLPMIDEIVKKSEVSLDELDAISVCAGPGSFTGLRIGSATAKGIGMALGIPLIPVKTTEALCYNLYGYRDLLCPIMDARRGQVYTGIFEFDNNNELKTALETTAMSIEELIEVLNGMNKKVTFLGDGVKVFRSTIETDANFEVAFALSNNCLQRASSVALYGEYLYKKGIYESANDHAPIYLRMSQAERERMEKS